MTSNSVLVPSVSEEKHNDKSFYIYGAIRVSNQIGSAL